MNAAKTSAPTRFVEIELNGKRLLVSPARTILDVAALQGIEIPTLCHDPRLQPYASCWLCVVRVQGAKGFVPACATMVRQGMRITTDDADIHATRRMALELLISSHYGDCKPPCTLTCPSNIDVQGYLGLIANGRTREALELIKQDCPFPAAIGRICPRPCETACRRNLVDEPVGIDYCKRYVADLDLFSEAGFDPPLAPKTGKRVAVVGGGPAGLSAAYYLAQKGVAVTVFESEQKAGGMLRYGIPDYRLPQDALDKEIHTILRLGVELKTGVRLGRDIELEQLRKSYDAVLLAFGAWKSHGLKIQGEDRPGILAGIDFLRDIAMGKKAELGRTVAVIGGGNTAIDSARTAVRLGVKEVNLFYRRTDVEMPASATEVREALEEGVRFYYLVAPLLIQEKGKGLKTLRLIKMQLGELDASGRRRPVPIEGSDFEVEVDTIITAIGQFSDTRCLESAEALLDQRGFLACDPQTGRTRVPGVFAAGDLVTGPDIAIRAIAGAKHAARAILAYLAGEEYRVQPEFLSKKEDITPPAAEEYREEARIPRETMSLLPAESRIRSFDEVEQGYSAEQALKEAERCLECGCQDVRECKLKEYAQAYGASSVRFPGEVQKHAVDESHPYIRREPAKCVLCGRCIRICLEVQGLGVLGYVHRGFKSMVVPTFGMPFGEDPLCIRCGQCVSACPVGALTEKIPGGKTMPLEERVEEGFCSLCSVGCPVEFRYHGSLLIRVKERYLDGMGGRGADRAMLLSRNSEDWLAGPGYGGRLCEKGKFGHAFLNAANQSPGAAGALLLHGRTAGRPEAQKFIAEALSRAHKPLLRISPLLAGEAIDRFLAFARQQGIPVEPEGLQGLEPGWRKLLPEMPEASGPAGEKRLILIAGNLDQSNNVAFTECLALQRAGLARLWFFGPLNPVYERFFERLFPKPDALAKALGELRGNTFAEVLLNPEELLEAYGKPVEKAVLKTLLDAAAASTVRTTLFWNSRNAAYLLKALDGMKTSGTGDHDLLLEAGTGIRSESLRSPRKTSVKAIEWGLAANGAELFITLPRAILICGYSTPSGRSPYLAGELDRAAIPGILIG